MMGDPGHLVDPVGRRPISARGARGRTRPQQGNGQHIRRHYEPCCPRCAPALADDLCLQAWRRVALRPRRAPAPRCAGQLSAPGSGRRRPAQGLASLGCLTLRRHRHQRNKHPQRGRRLRRHRGPRRRGAACPGQRRAARPQAAGRAGRRLGRRGGRRAAAPAAAAAAAASAFPPAQAAARPRPALWASHLDAPSPRRCLRAPGRPHIQLLRMIQKTRLRAERRRKGLQTCWCGHRRRHRSCW